MTDPEDSRCRGCGRYSALKSDLHGYCPKCAALAHWLRNPEEYPPLKTDPEKFDAYAKPI